MDFGQVESSSELKAVKTPGREDCSTSKSSPAAGCC